MYSFPQRHLNYSQFQYLIDGSVLLKSVDLLVLGLCGAFPLDRRDRAQSNKVVVLRDDDRRAVSTDYDGHFYKELICLATQPGQYVLFQHTCSGKDRIVKLKSTSPILSTTYIFHFLSIRASSFHCILLFQTPQDKLKSPDLEGWSHYPARTCAKWG